MRRARVTVRLTGIALRHQGSHDSLCAYYSAAMLLCALRPELEEQFDAAHVARDPLFANLPRRRRQSIESVAAGWLTAGVALPALTRALDAAAGGTRFRYRRARCDGETLAFLQAQVDAGLPCLLGWESREMGDHTSLVVGYDHFITTRNRWLRVLDPIRMQEQIEWRQLQRLATSPLELVWCHAHAGVRPDKLTVARATDGTPLATRSERWDPRTRSWQTLY
jgi:hypothetical protein